MVGVVGIILSLAFIIFGTYRGWSIFPVSLVGGLIVVVTNGMSIWESFATGYASGWMSWAGGYFLMFAFGSLFGELMSASGAAKSIAYTISDRIGAKHAPIAIAVVTLVMTYGGINAMVIAFTVAPLAFIMCNEANIPRALVLAGSVIGGCTATMTAIPGTPSTQNIIPSQFLGTTPFAAPAIGIVCGIIMVALGFVYIIWQQKVYLSKGIGFVALPSDGLGDTAAGRVEAPHIGLSIIPVVAVIAFIFATGKVINPMASVVGALLLACILTLALFWKRFPDKKASINKGFTSSIGPLMSTAAIIGYGSLVQASPAFQAVILFAKSLTMDPYTTTAVGVNLIAGFSGSASGGAKIFLESMAPFLLEQGVNPEALHRVAAIASGGLDMLPHNGGLIASLVIWGSNHKESYRHIFVVSVLIPLIATVVAVIMANLMYPVG